MKACTCLHRIPARKSRFSQIVIRVKSLLVTVFCGFFLLKCLLSVQKGQTYLHRGNCVIAFISCPTHMRFLLVSLYVCTSLQMSIEPPQGTTVSGHRKIPKNDVRSWTTTAYQPFSRHFGSTKTPRYANEESAGT